MIKRRGTPRSIFVSCLLYVCLLFSFYREVALSLSPIISDNTNLCRRDFTTAGVVAGSSLITPFVLSREANAASPIGGGKISLIERLNKHDPAALSNSIFNISPKVQVYPPFMRGSWNVTLAYGGYLFPSQKIPRSRLTTNTQIPGFQKCSIAALSDVGKEVVHYTLNIDETTGLEDRETSLTTSINDHLGYSAVQEVLYSPKANPNRLSAVFVEYKTTNAERIELFCNGRDSELVQTNDNNNNVFVCSEYIRQVTFSGGSQVGIPRQVGTNYAHFWTWKENNNKQTIKHDENGNDDDNQQKGNPTTTMTGNLLTACFLDPSDAMFFEEPSKPVAVFSHVIKATQI
jgi:hypothetical protein